MPCHWGHDLHLQGRRPDCAALGLACHLNIREKREVGTHVSLATHG